MALACDNDRKPPPWPAGCAKTPPATANQLDILLILDLI